MDPNIANQQTAPVNPTPVVPQAPSPTPNPVLTPTPEKSSSGKGKMFLKVFLVLLFLAILSVGGFFGYKYYFAQNQSYNAGVYKEPQTVTKVTPTPSGYQVNPNDSSNQAIDNDTAEINQGLNKVSTDLSGVDQSITDQQTSLQ